MDIKKIADLVSKYLPKEISESKSYIELKKMYFNLVKDEDIVNFNVREDIIERNPILMNLLNDHKIVKLDESCETLFALFTKNSEFTVSYTNKPVLVLNLITELEDDVYNTVEIEVVIDNDTTLWRTADYHKNESEYYFNYKIDMHLYNKDGDELLIEDLEERLDDDFSATFGIPMEKAKECRENFDDYIDYLNDSKARLYMEGVDMISSSAFISPFKISELGQIILGYDDEEDTEYYEENEEDEYSLDEENELDDNEFNIEDNYIEEEQIEEMEKIKNQLITYMGNDGEFVMSLNLFDNITDYVNNKVHVLSTNGVFVRKLNEDFTIFYVHINNNGLIIFPKDASNDDVKKLYEADPLNDEIEGLKEFFGINNVRKYKSK